MKESKLIKGVVATVAVIAFAVPAISGASDEVKGRAVKVNYTDLNVDKESGAEVLYRRLQQASKEVCGVESIKSVGGIREIAEQRRCYEDALDKAVANIDNPILTKIHEG
jgi:UrcA family protein